MSIKQTPAKVFIAIFVFILLSSSWADSPYQPYTWDDLGVWALTVTGGAASLYLDHRLQPLTEDDVGLLTPETINRFDRFATRLQSEAAATRSDWGMRTALLLPVGLLAGERIRNDGQTVALLYFQTMAITGVLTELSKTAFQRLRPYAYNPEVGLQAKLARDTKKAFFSGHTSASFAGSVLFAKLFSDYYPNSAWKPYVWAGSLTLSSLVAYWRVRAGRHFPSDVFAGALVGGAVAYLVPHLRKVQPSSQITTSAHPATTLLHVRFSF